VIRCKVRTGIFVKRKDWRAKEGKKKTKGRPEEGGGQRASKKIAFEVATPKKGSGGWRAWIQHNRKEQDAFLSEEGRERMKGEGVVSIKPSQLAP